MYEPIIYELTKAFAFVTMYIMPKTAIATVPEPEPEDSYAKIERNRRNYEKSEKGKEKNRRYNQSEKGKKARKRYYESDKGQEATLRYNLSDKKKAADQRRKDKVAIFNAVNKYKREHPEASQEEAIAAVLKELDAQVSEVSEETEGSE